MFEAPLIEEMKMADHLGMHTTLVINSLNYLLA